MQAKVWAAVRPARSADRPAVADPSTAAPRRSASSSCAPSAYAASRRCPTPTCPAWRSSLNDWAAGFADRVPGVPAVGHLLPRAGRREVRRAAARRRARGVQGARAGRRVRPARPAARPGLGAARGGRHTRRDPRRLRPGARTEFTGPAPMRAVLERHPALTASSRTWGRRSTHGSSSWPSVPERCTSTPRWRSTSFFEEAAPYPRDLVPRLRDLGDRGAARHRLPEHPVPLRATSSRRSNGWISATTGCAASASPTPSGCSAERRLPALARSEPARYGPQSGDGTRAIKGCVMTRSRNIGARLAARWVAVAGIIAATVVAAPQIATARPAPPDPDGAVSRAPTPAESGEIDLADVAADRWIVQLDGAPVAVADTGVLDLAGEANIAYRDQLKARQAAFRTGSRRSLPAPRSPAPTRSCSTAWPCEMSPKQAAAVRDAARRPRRHARRPVPARHVRHARPDRRAARVGPARRPEQRRRGREGRDHRQRHLRDPRRQRHYAGNPCFDDAGYTGAARAIPKGDTRFTNNKVIVARAYFRPDDPPTAGNDTPIQGPRAAARTARTSPAPSRATPAPGATIQGVDVELSGVAPHAYLMNYRVFYPSAERPTTSRTATPTWPSWCRRSTTRSLDGADVISNSWGSSYQNTLAWPDPMVQAAEAAVDAGVVMVFAQGNSGPDRRHRQLAGELAEGHRRRRGHEERDDRARRRSTSPHRRPVPPELTGMPVGPGAVRPAAHH